MDSTFLGCYYNFYTSDRYTDYIKLLYLGNIDKINKSIVELSELPSRKSWAEDTLRLISGNDWRYQIAPLVSYLSFKGRSTAIEQALWDCIVRGSWVSPQIVSGLYLKGADVVTDVVEILQTGIHSDITDPWIAHVEQGSGSNLSRQGKLLNSIIGLGLRENIAMANDEIEKMISLDIDCADRISMMWHQNVVKAFKLCINRTIPDG